MIPVAIRRWRRQLRETVRSGEWSRFRAALAAERYDLVIDAQGLLKSAVLTRLVDAPRAGYDRHSIREPLASLFYDRRYAVSREQHAVERIRQLFALALDYSKPAATGDYGLSRAQFADGPPRRQVLFLHGTTWPTKLWPESYWRELCREVTAAGFAVRLPWGNDEERARAERIAAVAPQAIVLPRLKLRELAAELAASAAVVAVDTGLGHLAAALNIPALSLYGPTRPALVGAYGANQIHLCAADLPPGPADVAPAEMAPLTPAVVWQALAPVLAAAHTITEN